MVVKMWIISIIVLTTFTASDLVRIRLGRVEEQGKFEEHTPDGGKSSAGILAALESPVALIQKVSSSITFAETLDYVKRANARCRTTILKAACDSSAFSCDEIIQFASYSSFLPSPFSFQWANTVMLFAEGRNNTGCISDPANARLIAQSFDSQWPAANLNMVFRQALKTSIVDIEGLRPAKGVRPAPMRLQAGCRTDEEMDELLASIRELQLIKTLGAPHQGGGYGPRSGSVEFEQWLKDIRADGEQFSWPQVVTLVNAIPPNFGTAQTVSVLLQHLEQFVIGVTCKEVGQVMWRMVHMTDRFFMAGLAAIKSNIIDGQNKVAIVSFSDLVYTNGIQETEELLRDVGVGLPPKNNPVFGVVKGNPVIFVLDDSHAMDAKLTLGADTFARRDFCQSQLQIVLEGLPTGTHFNVIRYSSSAVKIFRRPVLANRTSIDAAMEAVSERWRSNYTPGQDAAEMIRRIQAFALKLKHQIRRSTESNSREALQLAYATVDLPSQQTGNWQHSAHGQSPVVAQNSSQIYFVTVGQQDGGEHQILDNVSMLDKYRSIPVNSIAFITPADHVAKTFFRELSSKTGGFIRSIEHASRQTYKRELELGHDMKTRKKAKQSLRSGEGSSQA